MAPAVKPHLEKKHAHSPQKQKTKLKADLHRVFFRGALTSAHHTTLCNVQRQLLKSHSSSSHAELICCDWSDSLNNINLHTIRSVWCCSSLSFLRAIFRYLYIAIHTSLLSGFYSLSNTWIAHKCIQNDFIVWKTAIMKTASCNAMLCVCMCVTVIPQRTRVIEAAKKERAWSLLGTSAKFFNCDDNSGTPWWRISPPAGDCFNLFSSASD